MNTHPTYRIAQVIGASGESCEPIFRERPGFGSEVTKRCQCGYPMPCSINVPVTLCRAAIAAAGVAA